MRSNPLPFVRTKEDGSQGWVDVADVHPLPIKVVSYTVKGNGTVTITNKRGV